MKKIIFTIVIVCSSISLNLWAQAMDADALLLELVAKQSEDLHTRDTLYMADTAIAICDTVWNIYPHPLCMDLMYVPAVFPALLDTTEETFSIQTIRAKARRYITQNHATMYVSVSDPKRLNKVKMDHIKIRKAIVRDFEEDQLDLQRAVHELNTNWRKQLNVSLQITQNYSTPNWYQGQSSAFAMLASAKGYINFKNEKISWENSGEWRSGLSTVNGDSLRMIKVTDDVFRLNSKFGFQVHKHWYISANTEFRTNFWNNYKTNSYNLSTAFLTPIRFTFGVGVDYKPVSGLSVNVSPGTYKMVYALAADKENVNVADFGILEGENILNELGSSVRVDWKWRPLREIEIETLFYFFTNYKRIETELEIDVDFTINRYLSAKVMIHPRYDSTIELPEGKHTKIQFKELISVGFSHTFR